MKMKRMIGLSMTGLVAVTLLASCGAKKKESASTTKLPDPTYKVDKSKPAWKSDKSKDNTLTWYVNAEWWDKKYGTDLITKQVKKDLNLDIKFIIGDDTKLNTYFASGDIPDIVLSRVRLFVTPWTIARQAPLSMVRQVAQLLLDLSWIALSYFSSSSSALLYFLVGIS